MDLMSQLPVLKTQASNPTAQKPKARTGEVEAAEVVSFPTLLQDSKKQLEASVENPSLAVPGIQDTPPQTVPQPSAELLNPGILFEGISPLLSNVGENIPVISKITIAGASEGASEGAVAVVAEVVAEVAAEVAAEGPVESAVEGETNTYMASTPSLEIGNNDLPSTMQSANPQQTIIPEGLPKTQEMTSAEGVKNAEKGLAPATEIPIEVTVHGKPVLAASVSLKPEEKLKAEEKEISLEMKTVDGKVMTANTKAEDIPLKEKAVPETSNKVSQQVLPELETMKVEVVKEAATREQASAPVVENPILARQTSAELDLLSAQANAQKNYEQAPTATDQQSVAQATLADLDLDSGSSGSKDQAEQGISKILSTLAENTSPMKQKIRSQVLSRVVEHLQEEMGKEKLTIRLNPEKLGQIEVLFQAQDDQLNITMTGSTKEAELAIQEGVKELSENIADRSQRWNLVEIRVENRNQDQQPKQDSRQDDRRDKQHKGEHQQQEGHRSGGDHNQETGASEWAAFHLGG